MPKRTDLKTLLVIGSGPITIGQACEFDYSGTQALKALRREGYRLVLVNSNPATIMTDPGLSDRTYLEPLRVEFLERIIEREKPQALLPTMGGQTALNLAVALAKKGVLARHKVELIGATVEAIEKAEDRRLFKAVMESVGLEMPKSRVAGTVEEAVAASAELGFPIVLRPSFTLGGEGGGIAHDQAQLRKKAAEALAASPVREVLIEESVLGWKEFELEVVRDSKDNAIIVCSIENFDPMGVHTGDSITVAPAQTLTDVQYQVLRDAALKAVRAIGVDTGGCNVQFAVDPRTGRSLVIEINPRVSRSSALASKATGYPIAKVAALLAVGFSLDEIPNDVTGKTQACFEPAIDYVVTKVPRFAFEKFPGSQRELGTSMKSVGEVMAIGRTFKESLQKALRSLELGRDGFECAKHSKAEEPWEARLRFPAPDRIFHLKAALQAGVDVEPAAKWSGIDPWFLFQLAELVDLERRLSKGRIDRELLREAKQAGFSDGQIGRACRRSAAAIRTQRRRWRIEAGYNLVDTCAAEFEARTPYYYSTFDGAGERRPPKRKNRVVVLGAGPNRIGQGIEFDYCCVRACEAFRDLGCETVMVNCNPETVSTDYDSSDRLYFEPLSLESVLAVLERERPSGVVVQLGGQTPLGLASGIAKAGFKILGTDPKSIDLAEDRERFSRICKRLGIPMPEHGTAMSLAQAARVAKKIGYPVLLRPSYVLGGRAMQVVYGESYLRGYMEAAAKVSPDKPVLIDRFLRDAIEVDVDALSDGRTVFVGGIMEHIEEAGIHSGDSACSLPPHSLTHEQVETILHHTKRLALALRVRGLLNIQFAVQDGKVLLLEANPRASRTVPFVSKATGVPLASLAAQVMAGRRLVDIMPGELLRRPFPLPPYTSVKAAVVPFARFPGVDPRLGPEMKSTGEVMGVDSDFGRAFAKSQAAAGMPLPVEGTVFISVQDADKPFMVPLAKQLAAWGFKLVATEATEKFLRQNGVAVERVYKIGEGKPDIVELIRGGKIGLVINTPSGQQKAYSDGYLIRRSSLEKNVPSASTPFAARAALRGIAALRQGRALELAALQDCYDSLDYPRPAERAGRGAVLNGGNGTAGRRPGSGGVSAERAAPRTSSKAIPTRG